MCCCSRQRRRRACCQRTKQCGRNIHFYHVPPQPCGCPQQQTVSSPPCSCSQPQTISSQPQTCPCPQFRAVAEPIVIKIPVPQFVPVPVQIPVQIPVPVQIPTQVPQQQLCAQQYPMQMQSQSFNCNGLNPYGGLTAAYGGQNIFNSSMGAYGAYSGF